MSATAVLYVRRLDVMRAFYQECFGLKIIDATDAYCVLESDDWTLSLVVTRHAATAQIEVPDPPTRRDLSPIKLGFRVRQIEDLRPVFESLGGHLDAGTAAWEFYGFACLDGVDPEGNVVQLLQPLTHS
jgi:catechol 2,3-dioxygenase-like lactoylglutathione lyase family enzyme